MKKVVVLFALALGFVRAASASAEGSASEPGTYTVQPGDRLERVAARYGLTGEELLAANPRSAYGIACDRPQKIELRDGTIRFVCGRPRVYLIAGKTLIVPEPRILIQAENGALRTELEALRAEMAELEEKYEAEKSDLVEVRQERDDLISELDDLRDENKGLVAARAEASGQHDELQSNLETVLSHQPKQVEVRATNATHIVLAVALTAFVAVLAIVFVSYRKGKKFNHLVQVVHPGLIAQAEKNKKRGAELDLWEKKLDRQAREQDDLGTKLGKEKAEQDKQEKDLAAREATQKQGEADLDAAKRAVADREATCTRREGEIKEAEHQLLGRTKAFSTHVREEDERLGRLRGELNGTQARLEGQAATQEEKERRLASLREILDQTSAQFRTEQAEFAKQRGAVEGAMRCLDEDVPALEEQRRQLKAREDEVTRREGEVTDHSAVLAGRERDVRAVEERLARAEDDLRRRQAEFERFTAEARQELEDRARGLDDREERHRDLSREADDEGETRRLPPPPDDPSDMTGIDPPGSEPVMGVTKVLCPDCGHEVSFDKLDEHRAVAHGIGAREEIPGSKTCVRPDGEEVPLASREAHLGSCAPPPPASADVSHETGPHIPVAAEPSHEESEFYCSVCRRAVSAEEYAWEHATHDTGLPKPE